MNNKEKYTLFCQNTHVPIYSKPWWMDAVCGEQNWDVWLYEKGDTVLAAMPYYLEVRGDYRYITKAPLTQNNGVIIRWQQEAKTANKLAMEEEVYQAACDFIKALNVDVYEQQYMPSVVNWLPFFWNGYSAIPRYTFVIRDTTNPERIFSEFSHNCRKNVRKGQKSIKQFISIDPHHFYTEHKKIFDKQGIPVPFSETFWENLWNSCNKHNAGKIIAAQGQNDEILAVVFLVWDEEKVYLLLGGGMPEFSSSKAYTALVYEAIQEACKQKKSFDFEGSVIRRINRSAREFGGEQTQYFRIRKVFNPDIIRAEAEQKIQQLAQE